MHIENPCPINSNQLKDLGNNCFYCSGCEQKVIDFTNSTTAEIEQYKGKKVCGIFNNEQLTHLPVLSFRKRISFKYLSILSFFGFAIHPVQASELRVNKAFGNTAIHASKDDDKKDKKKKKRRKSKKQQTFKTIGCPSF